MKSKGFTIVELLIVIVVIAILAAITVGVYSSVRQSAEDSRVKSNITQAAKKIEAYRLDPANTSDSYPASLAAAGVSNLDITTSYQTVPASNYYCIDGVSNGSSFHQSSLNKVLQVGLCPPTNGLITWFPLNGSAVNSADPSIVATNNGATPAMGQNGQANNALQFNTSEQDYIDTNLITTRANFTVSVWTYATSTGSYLSALSETRDCCGTGYRGIELKSSYPGGNTGISIWAGGSGSAVSVTGSGTSTNRWSMLTGVYDGTNLYMYNDGVLTGTSGSYTSGIGTPTTTLKIGRAGVVGAAYFNGLLDDVRVYNRALSANEVSELYKSGAE